MAAASVLSPASAASLGVGGLTAETGDGGAASTTELAWAAGSRVDLGVNVDALGPAGVATGEATETVMGCTA